MKQTDLSLLSFLLWITLVFFSTSLLGQSPLRTVVDKGTNFYDIQTEAQQILNQSTQREAARSPALFSDSDYHKYKRWEWYWRDRVMPDGTFPDLGKIYKEVSAQRQEALEKSSMCGANWTNINQLVGDGGYNGMGRTTSIAFHPTDPNTYYVSTPIGGIWKTTDHGATYNHLSENLPFLATSAIEIDYNNPNTIYIAMGDNVSYGPPSLGVYKSTDGGASWQATAMTFNFADNIRIWDMAMSPTNPNVILLATDNGLYRTDDGFATVTQVRNEYYKSVEFKPGSETVAYASQYGTPSQVFKTTDGGVNWGATFNGDNYDIITLAVTVANTNVVAFITSSSKVYYSTNEGNTFALRSNTLPEFHNNAFTISQTNPNVMYSGYLNVHASTDGGANWVEKSQFHSSLLPLPVVHGDQRNMKVNPLRPNYIYFCNDGGIYYYNQSSDTWTERTNGLIITQYYRIAVAQTDNDFMIGGTQDNGGRKRIVGNTWAATNGGDAMEVKIDPTNAQTIYTTYTNGLLYRSYDQWNLDTNHDITPGGDYTILGGDWVMPYTLDPSNANTIVAGYRQIWRSTNRGDNWTAISGDLADGSGVTSIAVAPSNSNWIYAGYGENIYRTTDLGANWQTFTVPTADNITSITVDELYHTTLWVTLSGYTAGQKVMKSVDGGTTWTNVSGSIPNIPVNEAVFVNGSDDAIYVATDGGVYYTDNTKSDWCLFGTGLPFTQVSDVEVQYSDSKVRIGTHGRGVWEIDLAAFPTACTDPVACVFPPVALFFPNGASVVDSIISFDGSLSNDPNNDILTYVWDFGDGTTDTGVNPSHIYTTPGTYVVTLTVDDGNGGTATYTYPLTIEYPICGYNKVDCYGQTSVSGSTIGQDDIFNYYAGAHYGSNYSGGEDSYTFTTPGGAVTITVSDLNGDVDLLLMSACDPSSTFIAESTNNGTANETITINLAAGTYYIFIDGYNGATSDYSLSVDCAGVSVGLKVFLRGPYSGVLMNDALRVTGILPANEPYMSGNNESFDLTTISSASGNDAIVDWVTIELRDSANPATVLSTRSALLQRDGDVVEVDGVSPVKFAGIAAGSYYVAVKHRNHLGVMTKVAIDLN